MEAGFFHYSDVLNNPVLQARIAAQKAERARQQQQRSVGGSDSLPPPLSPTTSFGQSSDIKRAPTKPTDGSLGMAYAAVPLRHNNSISSGHSNSNSTSSSNEVNDSDLLANPYELRHGRRYLRDMPYALPCDLAEMHRQSLRTLLGATAFAKAACAPTVTKRVPKTVLEVGCGSAYWTSCCHEYFTTLGSGHVSFTGIDIAPVAPNLRKQGLDWRFVQHDIRRRPWPFQDGEFDYIMIKDMSLAVPLGVATESLMTECARILSEGGTLEIRESDHGLRCLLPNPQLPNGTTDQDEHTARLTRTYLTSLGTPFASAQNKYIRNANAWMEEALLAKGLGYAPCAGVAEVLFHEPESLCNIGFRRVAIPLTQLPWEKERQNVRKDSRAGLDGKSASHSRGTVLTADQAALRHIAFLTYVQKVESLEPMLREASGKNTDEWANWWANMMSDLTEQDGAAGGEALEIGSWWATKKTVKS